MLTFLLTLIVIAGVLLFARWLHTFLQQYPLTAETRLLILIISVGVLLLLALSSVWRSDKPAPQPPPKTSITPHSNKQGKMPQTEQDLDSFEQQTYPALYGLRQDMLRQLQALKQFFSEVNDWAKQMPNQRRFLQKIVNIRWQQAQTLEAAYQSIDRSRRAFWVHFHTGEDQHVRQMFDSEASRLQRRIQTALGDSNQYQLDELDVVSQHIRDALALLKASKLIKPKVGQAYSFQPYAVANRQRLRNWLLQQQEHHIVLHLDALTQSEMQMREKIDYILAYRKVNTDLQFEVNELLVKWNDALIYNQYAQYRLLFGVEALELFERLGILGRESRDYNLLLTQLRDAAPKLVQQAEDERRIAAFSYNPDIDQKYRKKR